MHTHFIYKLTVIASIMCACISPENDNNQMPSYFSVLPIDTLIKSQAKMLAEEHKTFIKNASLNGQTESQNITLTVDEWKRELSVLVDFNIQKPRYQGAFELYETDSIKRFTKKSGEKIPIESIDYYFDQSGQLTGITGVLLDNEAKWIYTTFRKIEVTFSDGILHQLQVEGYQKMIFKDTVFYSYSLTHQP